MRCAGQLRAVAYTDLSSSGAMRSARLTAIAATSRHASSANGNASATRWNMNRRARPPASAAPAISSTNAESTELTSATRNVRSARPLKCMRLHGLIASASSAMIAAEAIWPAAGRPSANGFGAWERDVIVGSGSELKIEKNLHLADAEEYDRERRADEEQRTAEGRHARKPMLRRQRVGGSRRKAGVHVMSTIRFARLRTWQLYRNSTQTRFHDPPRSPAGRVRTSRLLNQGGSSRCCRPIRKGHPISARGGRGGSAD